MTLPPALAALDEAMRGAGRLALELFGRTGFERKADSSLVTEADRAVERYLVPRLLAIEPGARILGEEGTSAHHPPGSAPTWAVDPIDGTAVFVAGLSTWAVSVGLVRDGRPEVGAVHLPVTGEMFLAGGEGPLVWNGTALPPDDAGRAGEGSEAGAEPAPRPRDRMPDREAWVGVPSNFHRRYRLRFPGKVRSLGSTAAHFAWVARGAAVGAFSFGRLWDFAGGLACCRAAGVSYRYLSGREVDIAALLEGERTPEPIVAARPSDLDRLCAAIELLPPRG